MDRTNKSRNGAQRNDGFRFFRHSTSFHSGFCYFAQLWYNNVHVRHSAKENPMLTREDILTILRDNKERFAEKYGVTKLGLFGSFARNEAT
jgi:hypothetical protein